MAVNNPFQSGYDPYDDSLRRQARSREEYEIMKAQHMQEEMMRMQQNAYANRAPKPEAPKPPKHLDKKLLLTKGA